MTRLTRSAVALLVLFVGASASAAAQTSPAPRFQIRASLGYDQSRPAGFLDRTCGASAALNFFGCLPGTDGRQIGSHGDFGGTLAVELAAGARPRLLPFLRLEGAVVYRPNFEFTGNATFLGAGNDQPVDASVSATALLVRALVDLPPFAARGRVRPFVGGGLGWSHNRIGRVLYGFPGLPSQPATTTTPGGVRWSGAWDLTAGAALRLSRRLLVEGGYRYSDFGRVATDDGTIEVVRGDRQLAISDVAGTTARLRSQGVYVGIRREF